MIIKLLLIFIKEFTSFMIEDVIISGLFESSSKRKVVEPSWKLLFN